MSQLTTIQKARKILSTYDEIEPRKYCLQPHPSSHSKSKSKRPSSSISHSASSLRKDFSFCRSRKQSPSPVRKQPSNPSFSSPYGRQTRYDKIMKLKVKPALRQAKQERNKQSVLSGSRSSISSQNKENKVRNKSRLERIMNLKVAKPQVASTLTNYHPPQGMKTQPKQRAESAAKEWRQSQQRMRRSKEQEQREERLWKVFERERQIRCQLKKRAEQRAQKQQRRRQQRFQSMVGKQVAKLQRERELSKRKSEGFTNYVYPFF